MTKSKSQMLSKIDHLLSEINEQYTSLKSNPSTDQVELILLAGKIDFLSAHIKALQSLSQQVDVSNESISTTVNVAGVETKETVFTPSSDFSSKDVDSQKVVEEIVEHADTIPAKSDESVANEVVGLKEEPVMSSEPSTTDSLTAPDFQEIEQVKEDFSIRDTDEDVEIKMQDPVFKEPTVQERQAISEQIDPDDLDLQSEPDRTEEVVSKEIVVEEKSVFVPEPTPVKEEKTFQPTRPLTLNEMIQQQKQAGVNVTQQFNTTSSVDRVVDLKTGISLNDKLMFIKDLFNGYSLAYSEAIELLNRFDNFAAADAFLQSNYALKNGWAEKPQTVEKLYVVLRKKFVN